MSLLRQSKKVIFQKQKPSSFVSLNSYYHELFRETLFEAPTGNPHNVFQIVKVPFYVEMFLLFGQALILECLLWNVIVYPFRVLHAIYLIIGHKLSSTRPKPTLSHYYDVTLSFCMILAYLMWYYFAYRICGFFTGTHSWEVKGESAFSDWSGVLRLTAVIAAVQIVDTLCIVYETELVTYIRFQLSLKEGDEKKKKSYLALMFLLSVTLMIHAILYDTMIDTLLVASRKPGGLFSLIFKEQMAEIKRDSLKKFSKLQVFNLICEDVMERFQQSLYIGFLLLLSLHKNNWVPNYDMLEEAGYLWFLLVATEMFVDWIKHGFITEQGSESKGHHLYDGFAQHLITKVQVTTEDNKVHTTFEDVWETMEIGVQPCVMILSFVQVCGASVYDFHSQYSPHIIVSLVVSWFVLFLLKMLNRFIISLFFKYYAHVNLKGAVYNELEQLSDSGKKK